MLTRLALPAAIVFASCLAAVTPARAYPALYYTEITMGVPPALCANAGSAALHDAGFGNLYKDGADRAGGTTPSTRGYVACVALPKAGSCGGFGSTAAIITTGDDALALNKAIINKFKKPQLIDCN